MAKPRSSLSISVRRHFVDAFFFANVDNFKGRDVLDIGGRKVSKRGLFNIDQYSEKVRYVNIDPSSNPDIISDAASIPLPDSSCDVVLLGETLEHVPDPIAVIKEAHRLLKTGGKLFASVPFLFPIHADPFDFGRYTDYYWKETSKKAGFSKISVERHGAIFAVMALAVQHLFLAKSKKWWPIQFPLVKFFMWLDGRVSSKILRAWTTGFGFILTK